MNTIDRFMAKVEKTDGCWFWTARKSPQGYGRFSLGGRNHIASRVVYELLVGAIPPDMHVLHRCDNPSCVNPSHLWLGTNTDNIADRMRKGRSRGFPGEANGNRRLTADDVRSIRREVADGARKADVARKFGVPRGHVGQIVSRASWRLI